ncbi:hypothetical protein [Mycobacterium colombiense]|uniref:hypothetical protein n=1 Tax=Mycobacterium colombiense TaxID=339268 RepID=UPI00097B6FCE|nr:hypothetical protein [Mycobacterium colombiense]OMC28879.1 hypothetical protein A5738_22560 [Mycobacterium colombiense]
MAFSLPADLATNWVDNIGMFVNAAHLNSDGALANANKAAILALVNGMKQAAVAANESTSSTSYGDLTTTTDSVTVVVGASGIVLVVVSALWSTAAGSGYVSYAASGANTIAASDSKCASQGSASGATLNINGIFVETGLAAGSTTFKLKYKVNVNSSSFANRRIAVIPFP